MNLFMFVIEVLSDFCIRLFHVENDATKYHDLMVNNINASLITEFKSEQ